MLSRGLECFGQSWDTFVRSKNAFYRAGVLSTGLECFRHSWNTFVQSWNAFYKVGKLSTDLEDICTRLKCFLQG
jgi:hypothetical protein